MNLRWTSAAIVAVLFALAQILPGRGLPVGQAVTNLLTGSSPAGESVGIALAARRSKDEKDKKDDNRNDNKHDNGDDDDDDENGNSNQDDSHEDAENVDAYENADNAPVEGQNDGEPEQAATPTPTSGSSSAASTAPTTAPSGAGGEPVPTPTLISPAAAAAPAAAPTRQRPAATPTPDAAQPTPTSADGSGTATAAGSQGAGAQAPTPSLIPTTEPMPTVGPPATEPQVSGVATGSDLSVALGGDRVVVQVFPSMPTGTTIFVKRATKDQFPPVPGVLVSDLIFVLEARDPSGGILLELPAQVNLIVHYQDADAGALVESRFTLSHLSLIDYSWRPTANQVKDAGANYVSAPISELGAYAVHVP